MSSYTVAKVVIDALVTAAVKWSQDVPGGFRYHWHYGAGQVNAANAKQVGQMLWRANWHHADGWAHDTDSADHEQVQAEPVYEYDPLPGVPHPLIVLRLIDNYLYQTADEPEEWRPTEAFGFVHTLQGFAIGRLLRDSELPWTLNEDDRHIFLRYGEPDPEPDRPDADNPDWLSVNSKLSATGIPFKIDAPEERRNWAAQDGTVPTGRWLTWPPDLGPALVQVWLYSTEAEAVTAFPTIAEATRLHVSPRFSGEVLRQGAIVLVLRTDHWNPDLDVWLDRLRNAFAPRDDHWSASHELRGANAPVIIVGWNKEHEHWDVLRAGEPSLTGVANLADAYVAAQERQVRLMIADNVYAAMVDRGDAPAERPTWVTQRPTGPPRLA